MKNRVCDDWRPRFGWSKALNCNPQIIYEDKFMDLFPVAVIPLPKMSAKIRNKIKKFAKEKVGLK